MGGAFGAAGFALGLACGMPIGRIASQRREREDEEDGYRGVFPEASERHGSGGKNNVR